MGKQKHTSFDNYMRPGTHDDFKTDFQTPPDVARYMVSLIPRCVKVVCEPTKGIGNIESAILDAGFKCYAPDDYFEKDAWAMDEVEAFCMNPPFSHKFTNLVNAPVEVHEKGMRMGYWFLTDAMKRAPIVVALMPWFTISDSDVRLRMLKRYGLKSLTALPRKTFEFARIQTVVIELERGYKGETIFKAYDCLTDHEQHKIFQ